MSKKSKKKEKKLNKVISAEIVPYVEPIADKHIEKIKSYVSRLNNLTSYQDIGNSFMMLQELEKELVPIIKEKGLGYLTKNMEMEKGAMWDYSYSLAGDMFGYAPQGSTFLSKFPQNPLAVFAILGDIHWGMRCCRQEYKKEVLYNGYYLAGEVAKDSQKRLDDLDMDNLRAQLVDHCKVFGQFWIRPNKSILGGFLDYTVLRPQDIRPVFSFDKKKIIAWKYLDGSTWYTYQPDELIHYVYNPGLNRYDVGVPPITALIVDIEADMSASMYNNVVFSKGGLLGLVVLMEGGAGRNIVPGASTNGLASQVEAQLRSNHSGARSGFDTAVLSGVKDVKSVNDLASLDGAFHKGSDKCNKQIAHVMDVPHERLGIITNASQQYHAASLEDKASLQFDKAVSEVVNKVDNVLNTRVLPLAKITATIKAKTRYNGLTRTGTQAGHDLASMDGVMTVDEYRVEILRLPPLGGKAGKRVLRLVPTVSAKLETAPPERTDVPIPPEIQE